MSDLATRLIAENKRTRAPFLDLGKCGLVALPAEVADLVWLESLSLADEWSERDGFQWQHKVSQNEGEPNSSFRDIRPLRRLTRMRSLVLSATLVADLAPLAGLSALTRPLMFRARRSPTWPR